MKSFLLTILGFFCVFQLSAQEIKEEQFIPKLKEKQEALYKLVDKKDNLVIKVANLAKEIEITPDASAKATKKTEKEDLEERIKKLTSEITEKCDEYKEYHTLLSKYQNVSETFLANYKVRICKIYATPEVEITAEEIKNESYKKKLKDEEAAIEKLVDAKFLSDKAIELLNKEIAGIESKLNVATLEGTERKKIEDELNAKKEEKANEVTKNGNSLKAIMEACTKFEEYKTYLKKHEGVEASVLEEFKARSCLLFEEKTALDPEKFIIIGDNDPVKVDSLFSNSSTRQVLANIFSIDSKTNLGKFQVPGDNEVINFYVERKRDKKRVKEFDSVMAQEYSPNHADDLITLKTANEGSSFKYEKVPEQARFKSIQIELLEGGIVDSRLILESLDGKTHFYFEGTDPVSLLNYSRRAPQRGAVLKFSHYESINGSVIYNEKALRELLVRYTDVLDYHPNAGNNYVPDDVSYTFPSQDRNEEKTTDKRSYQIINNNHLQHVLDIRTYTDFIGLFGDEANGLFQVEGKADFFIHPFNVRKTSIYWFKKVAPYVRYSRLDDDENFVEATQSNDDPNLFQFEQDKLSILEKTNLEMGFNTNFFQFRFAKEIPFWISFYIPLSYHVTNVKLPTTVDDDFVNFKTFGVGIGASIELKRLNNFGLNVGFEVKRYSNVGEYEKDNLIEPEKLETKAVNAEIFYYPNNNKSQSIFLRMRSIHDLSSNKEAFFQLQFGYRFTLGLGAIKAK